MKRILKTVLYTGLLALLLSLAASAAATEEPRCDNCGMFWDKSSTRIEATFSKDGKASDYKFECLKCLKAKLAALGTKTSLKSFKVLDYSTLGTKNEGLVDGQHAVYLYGTSALKGSMPEYIAAFSTHKAAEAAKTKLGGEVLSWKATWKKLNAE